MHEHAKRKKREREREKGKADKRQNKLNIRALISRQFYFLIKNIVHQFFKYAFCLIDKYRAHFYNEQYICGKVM